MIKIKDIKPYEFNLKDHPEEQIELMAKVIQEVGWRQPVVVNQNGVIVVGHGRWAVWEAYKKNPNFPHIWILDDRGNTIYGAPSNVPLTAEQEEMYRIADNRLSELAKVNMKHFNLVMEKIPEDLVSLTGYSDFTLDKVDEIDVMAEWEGMPEVNNTGGKIQGALKTIIVHFETEEDIADFSVKIGQKITDKTRYIWHPYKEKDDVKSQVFEVDNE